MHPTAFNSKKEGFHLGRVLSASAMSLLLLVGQTVPLLGNPTGGAVVAGSATIGPAGLTLSIHQSTQNAIINWQQFSIANGETTKFIVPNSGATLNRVTGGNPSAIYGKLQSNGTLYLVNPSGIVVGPSGRIDTASFLASTLDISNQQFLNGGNLEFAGNSGAAVENDGVIHASTGDVYLIANQVTNKGTLSAPQGTVGLAAGSDILFQQAGNEHLFVQATPAGTKRALGVTNSGTIRAAAAELKAAGGNAYALAINNTGVIAATGYKKINGQVYLTSDGGSLTNSGKISAKQSNGNGGKIVIDGTAVASTVSGTVTNSGTLNASAMVAGGQGGTITIRDMSGTTIFTGKIFARGGQGGAGGNAEISGGTLQFGGLVDLTAPGGTTGSLLFDPDNVIIQTAGPNTTTASGNTFTGGVRNSILTVASLQAALATANITVTTGSAGAQAGDITVNSAVTWSGSTTLTLSAYNNININASVTNTGGGSVTLRADNSGKGTGTVVFNGGAVIATSGLVTIFYDPASYTSPTNFGGDVSGGTLNTYMLVNTLTDLQNMQTNLGGAYALSKNIDATPTSGWNSGAGFVPIGTSFSPFTGIFNGEGYVINGLYINLPNSNSVGLFGAINNGSVLENVGLTNIYVDGSSDVGGLVGWMQTSSINVATNVYTTGAVIGNGGYAVGGLVGANDGLVASTYSTASVTFNGASGYGEVGGLVGYNYFTGTVSNSSSSGTVTAPVGVPFVGALVGDNLGVVSGSYSGPPPPPPPPPVTPVTPVTPVAPVTSLSNAPQSVQHAVTVTVPQPHPQPVTTTIVTGATTPPPISFTGTGIAQVLGQQDTGLASSSSNSAQVTTGDTAQMNDGQLNSVANPHASGALNEALGPIVYTNLSDALKGIGDWADVPDSAGGSTAGSEETILSGGDVAEVTSSSVKNIPLDKAPKQLQNAMNVDVLGAGH